MELDDVHVRLDSTPILRVADAGGRARCAAMRPRTPPPVNRF